LLPSQLTSMPEPNGAKRSTPSETNNNAVHAGLSVPLKLFQTDSPLPQTERSTLSSPQKTSSLATPTTTVAMVDTWIWLGNTSTNMEPSLTHVSHTLLVQDMPPLVPQNALTVLPSPSSLALMVQLDNLKAQTKLPLKSSPTAPLKLPSPYMKTSSVTAQVSITTSPAVLLVVTPSNSSVSELKMELSTGSLPTLGELAGVSQVSSRSNKVTAVLKTKSSHAPQISRVTELLFLSIFTKLSNHNLLN